MGGLVNLLNTAGGAFVTWAGPMLVQSSVLIVILAALDWVLHKRVRAVVRYWIWLLVLVKLALPPSFSSPSGLAYWVGGQLPARPAPVEPVIPAPLVSAPPHSRPIVSTTPRALEPSPAIEDVFEAPAPSHTEPAAPALPAVSPDVRITWQALVLLAWVAVVTGMSILLIRRALFVLRLVAQFREAPQDIAELLGQCIRCLEVRTSLAVRLSPLAASPSVCGLWHPVILLPEEMLAQLQDQELKSIFLHELAHIKRGDLWLNLVQTLLQIAYFYHPLLWAANARIRKVREQAVDETVLAALGEEAEDYPRTLLRISRLAFGTPALSLRLLGVVESKKALTDRIRHIVSRPFPQNARLGLLGLAALVVAAVVLLPMARGTERGARESVRDFVADREIPVGLVAGTPEHPRLAEVTWVRIDQTYDSGGWDLTARVGWSSVAEASWRIRVELLDDQGRVLPHPQDEPAIFTGKAGTPGRDGMRYARLALGPLRAEGRRRPAKVRVGLEAAQDPSRVPASDPSANRELVITAVDGRNQKPIPGATVIARASYRDDRGAGHFLLQSTDVRGESRIVYAKSGLGGLIVIVEKDGYATTQEHWSSMASRMVVPVSALEVPPQRVIEPAPAQPIGGLVQDGEGKPIANAQVKLDVHSQRANGMVSLTCTTRTDTAGRWTVEGIPSDIDTVTLEFQHPEYVTDRYIHVSGDQLAAAQGLTYVKHMDKGLTVSGRVLDDQGRPVPQAAVMLGPAYADRFCYGHADTRTDSSGQFRFGCARDNRKDAAAHGGSTGVLVEAPGYVPALQCVVVDPNLAPLEFHLSRGRTVTVRVVDPNQHPLAGAWGVMYPLADDSGYDARLQDTDEQGRVRIVNAPQGDVLLAIYKSGYLGGEDYMVPASEGEPVVTLTPAPRVRGTVCDAETGQAIPNFEVATEFPAAGRGRLALGLPSMPIPRARPGLAMRFQEGRFELLFGETPAKTVQLRIVAAGYEPATSEPIPLQGTRVMEFKLARDGSFDSQTQQRERGGPLAEPGVVQGIIQDPNGQPVPNATVLSHDLQAADVTTDAQGRFRLQGMPIRRSPSGGGAARIIVREPQRNLAVAVELNEAQGDNLVVTLAPGVMLTGQVVDARGQVLSGAEVSLVLWRAQTGPNQTGTSLGVPTRCDPDGHYEIRAVPPGQQYSILARAEGHGSNQIRLEATEVVGKRLELKPLVLQAADLSVSGVVVDTEGKPVANAEVLCFGPNQSQPNRPVQTDAQGRFTVHGLAAGVVFIQVRTQGRPALRGRARAQAGATDVKIVVGPMDSTGPSGLGDLQNKTTSVPRPLMANMASGRTKTERTSSVRALPAAGTGTPAGQISLSGKVIDAQDQPVAEAEVTLYRLTAGELGVLSKVEAIARKTTGADGAFTFTAAPATQSYREGRVIARKEGLALGWAAWPMQEDQRLEIRLGQPAALAGDVVDEAGRPIAKAEVHIALAKIGRGEDRRELRPTGFLQTKTDRNGYFVFPDMPAGATFEFLVEAPGRATIHTLTMSSYSSEQCQFAPGQAGIRLTLPVEARIEGAVVEKDSGQPVGGVEVRAHADWRRSAPLPSKRTVTASDGTFRFGGLPAGICVVELMAAPGPMREWVAEDVRTSVKAGETKTDLRMQLTEGAIVEALVKDPAGKPVEKVHVYLERSGQEQGFGASTDANGLARIRVIAGGYRIAQIYRPGYAPPETTDQVTVEEGQTQRIECIVTAKPKIAGVIRDEAGNLLAGVKVQATWIRMTSAMTGGAVSDASGRFDFPWDTSLPGRPVTAVIFVARDPLRNLVQALNIDEDTGPLDLKLQPGAIITGTVLNQQGQPLAGANARVMLRVDKATVRLGWNELATAGRDGVFEFKAVPPGREYTVEVLADGYGKQEVPIAALGPQEMRHDIGQIKLMPSDLSVAGLVVDPNDQPVAGAEVSASGEGQPNLRNIQTDAQGRFVIKGVCSGSIRLYVRMPGPAGLYGSTQAEAGATDVRIALAEQRPPQAFAPRRGVVLKGKPLPPLKDLGIDLPIETEGKVLLVCFWDMGQRPSRSCVAQLAVQAAPLRERGMEIVTVHAAKVEDGALRQWLEENKIPFKMGTIAADVEKAKLAWGVAALPHLILTDKKHVVVAEGFSVSELDKQVEAVAGR
jgi:beta-lactamase regulating signal transducer with metallopeptidase domain/protocatechuate 3,4-dioxygenase beta subunit